MADGKKTTLDRIHASYDEFPIALVITDPRLDDNPIVYVNHAFTELTGYTAASAVGRNCRFLQGPDTDKRPVHELADAIAAEEPIAVELVNYTATGGRFLNHLVVTPIRDAGKTIFFLGIQAGSREHQDKGIPAERLTDHLAGLEDTVIDQVSMLLKIVRERVAKPREPGEVITLLSSRIDCLAQLYAGVFRRHSHDEEGRVRLGAYLGRVCSHTHASDRSYNVRLGTDFVEAVTDTDTAAMIGLCLSELLANAFGDINPYDDGAEIEVKLVWADGGGATLIVTASSEEDTDTLLPEKGAVGARIRDTILPRLGTSLERSQDGGTLAVHLPLPMLKKDAV